MNIMIAFADAYRLFDNNQHCIFCVGGAACAVVTKDNGTYYMFNPHGHDMMGLKNYKGAGVLLYFQA